jgi:hypothetical protein
VNEVTLIEALTGAPPLPGDGLAIVRVVPLVQGAPGFVAGYWTSDLTAGKAYTMIMFESEEATRQFQAVVESDPERRGEAGISLELLTVTKVIAHAESAARPAIQT